jgi:hypothetical protein
MTTTLALHHRDAVNVGDRWSCPLDYLSVPGVTVKLDASNPAWRAVDADVTIVGGGVLATWMPRYVRPSKRLVGWGVGYTQSARFGRHDDRAHWAAGMVADLYGARDAFPPRASTSYEYVPCASCLHPAFDRAYQVQHEVVYYGHALRGPFSGVAPYQTNATHDVEGTIAFLASGAQIVTSSFHGMYWGVLLNRSVIVVPFGSKFYHLPYAVRYSHTLAQALFMVRERALTMNPSALSECRDLNHRFHQRVLTQFYSEVNVG